MEDEGATSVIPQVGVDTPNRKTSEIVRDHQLAFLEALFEDGDWIDVRTMGPDGPMRPRETADSIESAVALIEAGVESNCNVYVGVASRRTGSTEKDAGGKGNLDSTYALWVDVDLGPGYPHEDRESLNAVLKSLPIVPSMIVNSGGGVHLYWFLDRAYPLSDPEFVMKFEQTLKGLVDFLGGDRAPTDAPRIMRVPGTVNYPNEKKRKAGRTPARCQIEYYDAELFHAFEDFEEFTRRGEELARRSKPTAYKREPWNGTMPDRVQQLIDSQPNGTVAKRFRGDVDGLNGYGGNPPGESELDWSIIGLLKHRGVSGAEIEASLKYRRSEAGTLHYKSDDYFVRSVQKGLGSVGMDTANTVAGTGEQVKILTNNRQVREVIADCVGAVDIANDPPRWFRRGGQIVRVVRNDHGVGSACVIPPAGYLNVLTDVADYVARTKSGTGETPTRPPRDLAAAVFDRLASSDELPVLRSVSSTPIICEDGQIIDREGFDSESRGYFSPPSDFVLGEVSEKPTKADVKRALKVVLAPFSEFSFASEADRAHFVSALLTALLRQWFPTVPLFVIEAPIQGSGKTLAAMAISVIVHGTAGVGAAPESGRNNADEWRKRITSALLSAQTIVIFDNVVGRLGGQALSTIATAPTWTDRILGKNEAPELPNTPTWIFTTNNAVVDSDLIRRCIYIRLDPNEPAPHLRSGFKIPDLLAHLVEYRGEILAALYTIVRYWIQRGRPKAPDGTPRLGSFEKWSDVIPAILGAAGMKGMLSDLEERAKMMRDPDEDEAAEFLERWWERFPSHRIVKSKRNDGGTDGCEARELVAASVITYSGESKLSLPTAVALRDGVVSRDPAGIPKSLGRWLTFRRDRWLVAGEHAYRVRSISPGSRKHAKRWAVERRKAKTDGDE